jgi:hypothetical protein
MPLPPLVSDRLLHREELDTATRKANEYRARQYIKNYLNDLEEIVWILDMLPQNQVAKLFKDEDLYRLQALEEKILIYLDFTPLDILSIIELDGSPKHAEKTLLVSNPMKNNERATISKGRNATDQDIERASKLNHHLLNIGDFIFKSPGIIGSRDLEYYYRELVQMARKQKLIPVGSA